MKRNPKLTGVELIATERKRQIEEEKWTAKHDDEHEFEELATAASIYAMPKEQRKVELYYHGIVLTVDLVENLWPWDEKWWKPTPKKRIKELTKAGALIAAEIDRLIRYATELRHK